MLIITDSWDSFIVFIDILFSIYGNNNRFILFTENWNVLELNRWNLASFYVTCIMDMVRVSQVACHIYLYIYI